MHVLTLLFTNIIGALAGNFPFFLKFDNQSKTNDFDISNFFNNSSDPCTDFYEYACGGWVSSTTKPDYLPFWNNWESVAKTVTERLKHILEHKKSSNKLFIKAQNIYNACVNNKHLENRYLRDLKNLIVEFDGCSMVTQKWNEDKYDWLFIVAKIIRYTGIYPLLKLHVFIDLKNTSQHVLYIDKGELNLPDEYLLFPHHNSKVIKMYRTWILKSVNHLYPNISDVELKKDVSKIMQFEMDLAKLHSLKDKSKKISINNLENDFPLEWNKIINELFVSTSITIKSNEYVVIRNKTYLKQLLLLISKSGRKTVANYIIWSLIKGLLRETTDFMRQLSFTMDRTVYQINTDITREYECVNNIVTYMDSALLPSYSKIYFNSQLATQVDSIIKNLKLEFIKLLENNQWLQNSTKLLAIKKIENMGSIIGFTKELRNETSLKNKFEKLRVSDNHFINTVQLKYLKIKDELENLRREVKYQLPGSIFEVNAFYSVLQNFIYIPMSMLEKPFYYNRGPMIYNYGALGSIIGHEISHSLDNLGKKADSKGNIVNWWSKEDNIKFDELVNCFKNQYQNYNIEDFNTLSENIADNVGLKLSYNAAKTLNLSDEELFYTGFAHMWCEKLFENRVINDEHSPAKYRVIGVLENNKEYAKAFNCIHKKNSVCTLW